MGPARPRRGLLCVGTVGQVGSSVLEATCRGSYTLGVRTYYSTLARFTLHLTSGVLSPVVLLGNRSVIVRTTVAWTCESVLPQSRHLLAVQGKGGDLKSTQAYSNCYRVRYSSVSLWRENE
jgi:hypothetical protein